MANSTTYAFWWGNSADFPPDAQQGLDEFLEGLDGSAYLAIADQYMFGTKPHTRFGGNIYDHSPLSPNPIDPVTGADVFGAEVCSVLSAKGVKPDPNGIYMVYTSNYPPDMLSSFGACAYHEYASCSDGTNIQIDFVPNTSSVLSECGPSDVSPLFTSNKRSEGTRAMANMSAHEFMETITDPYYDGWEEFSGFTEVGDLCDFVFERGVPIGESQWKIQDIWSNQTGGCAQGAGREALVVGDISSSGATSVFDVPEAIYGMFSRRINSKGVVAGEWIDAGNGEHAFVRDNHGSIASFNAPGDGFGGSTGVTGINAAGTLTGGYADANIIFHGFLRDNAGTFSTIDAPNSGSVQFAGTKARNINSNGDVAGDYRDSNYLSHGFVRTNVGSYLNFDVPGAASLFLNGTWSESINSSGDVAGEYDDAKSVKHGFVRHSNGSITTFDAPHAPNGTFANAINDGGTIAGDFVDSNFVSHGYVRDPRGNIATFDAPGSFFGTFAYGINASGEVAGYYSDANGFPHGYVRDKAGSFQVTQIPWANFGSVNRGINDAGSTAGTISLPSH